MFFLDRVLHHQKLLEAEPNRLKKRTCPVQALKTGGVIRKAVNRVGKLKLNNNIMSTNVTDYPSVNFNGGCGEASGSVPNSATSTGMQPFQTATVNGGPPSNCVIANDGGTVYGITILNIAGPIYDYQISVDAQGPSGWDSGSMYLAFTDATGDTYYLSIYSSTREIHTVDYNSSSPAIVTIWWCDNSFTASGEGVNQTKADFRVTSPAKKE